MDFNERLQITDEGGLTIYERVMDGDYDSMYILALLEESYEAGVASGIDAAMDYL
jgi:hypothetical protein